MTLGRYDAAVSPSFTDGLTLEGFVGHTGTIHMSHQSIPVPSLSLSLRFLIFQLVLIAARKIAYLIRLPTDEHRVKVGISWLLKSTVDSVATLQTMLTKPQSES